MIISELVWEQKDYQEYLRSRYLTSIQMKNIYDVAKKFEDRLMAAKTIEEFNSIHEELDKVEDKRDLSYIIEYDEEIAKFALAGGQKAVFEAKANNVPITYLSGCDIIKEYPDGTTKVIRENVINKPVSEKRFFKL
jgi:hypothetical protein